MARPILFISHLTSREKQKHDIAHLLDAVRKREPRVHYGSAEDTSLDTLKTLIDNAIAQDYVIRMFSGISSDTWDYVLKHRRPELFIEADFYTAIIVPVDDVCKKLEIKWEDVEEYNMKWLILFITMRDGRTLEYNCEDYLRNESTDTQHPLSLEVREM